MEGCNHVRTHEKDISYATLQRHCTKNLKQTFPEMKLRGLISKSCTHVSVSDLYISTISPPFCCRKIGRPIVNRSKIHECGNWERDRAVSFLGINKSNLPCRVKSKILCTCMEFRQVIIRQQLFLLVNCKHLRALVIKPYFVCS